MSKDIPINIRIAEVVKELEESEGAKIHSQIKLIGMSYHIFVGNYNELSKALGLFSTPPISILMWIPENQAQLEIFQKDIIRLLHNYLASAKSLVEHTRRIARRLFRNKPFWQEYQARIDEDFTNCGFTHFVEQLRNYILHQGVKAFTTARLTLDASATSSIMLNVLELRKCEWTKLAPEYLKTLPDEVPIDNLVHTYQNTVVEFHKWFDERQVELHKEAYEGMEAIRQRLKTLIKPTGEQFNP